MKKSLIALAVAGAFAAPAFAATENVDVYGKVHVSVSMFDDQPNTVNDLQYSSNASRIGFKGAEDLGGGLSAIWQVESGFDLDEKEANRGEFASRNSFLGLKGGFGTALVGKHDTPLKLVGRAVDLFGDTMADSRNVLGSYAGVTDGDDRANNVLAYISPSFSGFTVAAAHVSGNAAETDGTDGYSLNATYTNGPIFAGLGYAAGDAFEAGNMDSHIRAAGGFTFGNFKIVGQYDTIESVDGANDFDGYMVGGAFTMGNVVLKANYMAGEVDAVGGNEPEQWTIGADYNLSKRTSVYALYAAAEDGVCMGSGAGSSDNVCGAVPVSGDDEISVISLGMTHSF